MNYTDKTKEELINELVELHQSYNDARDLFEKEISLSKMASEKAVKTQEEIKKAFMHSPDPVSINRHPSGVYEVVNERFTDILGYGMEDVAGKSSLELNIWVDTEDAKNFRKEVQEKGRVENFVAPFRKKNGSIVYGLLSASLIDLEGIIYLHTVTKDITEHYRTELENHILYEITQSVTSTNNLNDLLKMIHLSLGKVVYAENFFVALYNQKTGLFSFPYFVDKVDPTLKSSSLEKSCTAYVFRTTKPLSLTHKILDNLIEQNEVELVGSNSPSWVGIPLKTPSRTIGVFVVQHYEKGNVYSEEDVKFLISIGSHIAISIERKRTEEEIMLKNELLQTINAEKDKFFSILAHDLRGPLSAFVAATQILTEEIQTMGIEEIKEITQSMKTSATSVYGLLENLLEWSRLKRGVIDFIPEKNNLKKKIIVCTDVLSESARKKGIEITISMSDEIEIFADGHMFCSIIRNLVTNAIKFTPADGKVSLTADCNKDHSVEIKISDSGIGMTPELKNKLFLLNEKTNRKGTEGEPSTGLGLLLCKEFIEKHGGKIWVESEVGKGSTFSFIIPEISI